MNRKHLYCAAMLFAAAVAPGCLQETATPSAPPAHRAAVSRAADPAVGAQHDAGAAADRIDVELDASEADAALRILARQGGDAAGPTDADWRALFNSVPYVRLKKREASMSRAFEDAAFRKFLLSSPCHEFHHIGYSTLAEPAAR